MNRHASILIGTAVVALSLAAVSFAGEEHKHGAADAKAPAAKAVAATGTKAPVTAVTKGEIAGIEGSWTGEVLDLTCFASHPETGSGPGHASCAKTCIDKGLPVGLLIDNMVYIPVMKDHSAPNKSMGPFAGKHVTVKGVAKETNGVRFIEVASVMAAPEPVK